MRKVLRVILYTIGGLLVIIIGAVVFLNTGPGKRFVRDKAVSFLKNKLGTEVQIAELGYGIPKYINLKGVLFKDQANDTLLYAGDIYVNVDMLGLISGKIDVKTVKLENINANIYRNAPDTNFNFTYIINAFAGDPSAKPKEEKPEDTTSNPPKIDVNKVELDNIRFRFRDQTGGSDFALALNHLELKVKKIDLAAMDFRIRELAINGLKSSFYQDTSYLPEEPDTDTTQTALLLSADNIDLKNVLFTYGDNTDKFLLDVNLGNLQAAVEKFDLLNQKVRVDKLELENTTTKIVMGKHSDLPEKVEEIVDTLPESNWRVEANTLHLANVGFAMDDENKPRQQYGMDYAHLDAQKLALDAKDILYTADSILGKISHLAVVEQSGFNLKELKTNFAYHAKGGYLKDLYLQTSNTILRDYLEVTYPSLDSLGTAMDRMLVKTNLVKSKVGLADVLIFAPDLRKQDLFRKYGNEQLDFEAVLNGYLAQMNIERFYLKGLQQTEVLLKGKLGGLPETEKINYDLVINKLNTGAADIKAIVPPSALESIRVPNTLSVTGKVRGTVEDYNTDLVLVSSDGSATLKGYIYMSPGKGREKYDMYVNTDKLNVGKIIKQDSVMGAITAVLNAKGSSFDINTMQALVDAKIISAELMKYNYRDISLNAEVADKKGVAALQSADPNLIMQLNANADFTQQDPAVTAQLNIDSADLQALKFSQEELRIRTFINAEIARLNPDYPEGTVSIDKTVVAAKGERYFVDSLFVVSQPSADTGQNIWVSADFLQARVTGKTPLTQIGNVIQEHINRHYQLAKDSAALVAKVQDTVKLPADYNLALNATIADRPLLHVLLPEMVSTDTININANIDPKTLVLNVVAPQVIYGKNTIDSIKVNVNGVDSALTYVASLNKMTMPDLQLFKTSVSGELDNNEITADIKLSDSADEPRFAIDALLRQEDSANVVMLRNGLLLNYETWTVAEPNQLVIGKQGFYADNFKISKGSESISLASNPPQYGAPLNVDINQFSISNITEILQKDTLLANGVLNTKLVVKDVSTAPSATGTIKITELEVKQTSMGELNVELKNASANEIAAHLDLKGNENDIAVNGSYYPKPVNGNNFDLKVDLNALNLRSFEGLMMNQVRNSSGFIRGNIDLKGTIDKPQPNGEIKTDNLKTTITMLGSPYTMPQERIVLKPSGLTFDNFDIEDTLGNKITISGDVRTQNYRDLDLALKVNAKEWMVLNSTPKDNDLFYGKLVMSSKLNVDGPVTAPSVTGNLTVHDTTKFTVAIPQDKPGVEEREGIVEFVDMDDPQRYAVLAPVDTAIKLAMQAGAKIDVNVAIEENAEFNVVIDQATGDFLRVRGEANLNTTINPDGTIGLNGTYELKQGSYQLNYNLVKRRFDIQEGSTITFAGDPLQANANITAIYVANVPPYDLVERQVTDPAQLNFYKQRLPFDVQLKMKGELLKPEITFDIVLPEEKKYRVSTDVTTLVQAKLAEMRNNPSELNKQVFALLILNRFIADNPFESGAGGRSAEFIARQSASRFLSEQLNKVAGDLINGFEVNLDLESTEDYTTGEKRNKTDLNVSASKRLFDDRLTITVGNNFELEGQTQTANQNTSLVPGNLAADYQLSSDGRYMTRVYRRNELEDIIQGYVVETGVSFIITVEYNKFRSLFRKRNRDRATEEKNDNGNNNNNTKGAGN